MKRVLLLVGASGMLGRDVAEVLGDDFDLVAPGEDELDLTDAATLRKALRKHKPDVVVNAAAYTDVDGCEDDPDRAYRVNALGARNLAVQSEHFSAQLVHVSTDYVFDGEREEAYDEFSPTSPLGVYGRSKLAGEELVRSLCRRHFVLRTSVLFGPGGRSFVDAVVERARKGEDLRVPAGRVGCPTYTWDLAAAIGSLVGSERFGTYHFNQGEAMTRAELARAILRAHDLGGVQIHEVDPSELGERAPRPRHVVMDCRLWRLEGLPAPRSVADALSHYVQRGEDGGVTQGKGRGLTEDPKEEARSHQREKPPAWTPQAELARDPDAPQPPIRSSEFDKREDEEEAPPPRRRSTVKREVGPDGKPRYTTSGGGSGGGGRGGSGGGRGRGGPPRGRKGPHRGPPRGGRPGPRGPRGPRGGK